MPNRETAPPNFPNTRALEEIRQRVFADKCAYRSHLAKAPVYEKLRILEEMRDFTSATQHAREQNKALMAPAWAQTNFTATNCGGVRFFKRPLSSGKSRAWSEIPASIAGVIRKLW